MKAGLKDLKTATAEAKSFEQAAFKNLKGGGIKSINGEALTSIEDISKAAKELGLTRAALYRRLEKFNL